MENVSDTISFPLRGDSFTFPIRGEVYLVSCSLCSWTFVVSESSEKEVIGIFLNSENDVRLATVQILPKMGTDFFFKSAAKSIRNRLNFLRIGNLKAPPSRKEIVSLAALSIEQNVSLLILTLDSQAPVYTRAVFVLLAPLVSSAIEIIKNCCSALWGLVSNENKLNCQKFCFTLLMSWPL